MGKSKPESIHPHGSGPFSGRILVRPMGWPYWDGLHGDEPYTGKWPKNVRVYPILTSSHSGAFMRELKFKSLVGTKWDHPLDRIREIWKVGPSSDRCSCSHRHSSHFAENLRCYFLFGLFCTYIQYWRYLYLLHALVILSKYSTNIRLLTPQTVRFITSTSKYKFEHVIPV